MLQLPSISCAQLQRGLRLLCPWLASLGMMLSAGCVSRVKMPEYFNVDRNTPEFKQAVASETERQRAQGLSPDRAEKRAEAVVSRQIVQSGMDLRSEQVLPLVRALTAFDRPRGCWAYTTTTTTLKAGITTVLVETYDASQPEAQLWTLLSRDGQPPDEKAQAEYRAIKLREWKRQSGKSPSPDIERVKYYATLAEMEITPAAIDGQTMFSFTTIHKDPEQPSVEIPSTRETFIIDPAKGALLGHTRTHLAPFSITSALIVHEFAVTGEYTPIDPAAPPFPMRTSYRVRASTLGQDQGLEQEEVVYTNYRRVKCYDDRFEVQIGELRTINFISGKN